MSLLQELALLEETLQFIKDNPVEWNQASWRCGSGMCFAGHAVTLAGGSWATNPGSEYSGWLLAEPGEGGSMSMRVDAKGWAIDLDWESDGGNGGVREVRCVPAEYRARRLLGLTAEESDRLFEGDNSLEDIEADIGAIRKRKVRDAAAAYLDSKSVTLWGDFDIKNESGRKKAIKWLAKQVEGVLRTGRTDDANADERADPSADRGTAA